VVLVTDDTALYEPPLDGRFGYYLLTGMEVRTRSGDFLGKVSANCYSLPLCSLLLLLPLSISMSLAFFIRQPVLSLLS